MPTRSLKQLKAAMPFGMEEEKLYALLAEIFAAAQGGGEKPFDVADIFLEAIGRAADNYKRLTPEVEQRMLAWVKTNWATSPSAYFETLCAILVNLKTAEAGSFLEEQQQAATEEAIKGQIAYSLRNRNPEHPLVE